MRVVTLGLLVLTTTAHAQSVVLTYDQWERMPVGMKEMYVAGAIDSLSTISVPAQAGTAKYYNECLANKDITAHDIAEGMKAIVQARLDLHPKPATFTLLETLIKLCGKPVAD